MTENNVESNNPVTRLYNILEAAMKQPGTNAIRFVWADVLGIPRENPELVLSAISDLMWLYQDTRTHILNMKDVNREDYITFLNNVELVIYSFNIDKQWQSIKGKLTETTMQALKYASNSATNENPTKPPTLNELNNILKELTDIRLKILDLEFDSNDLKLLLVNYLDGLSSAITLYNIKGEKGLKVAIDAAFGGLFLNQDLIAEEFKGDKKKRVAINKLISTLANLCQIASLGIQFPQIAEKVLPLLGSGN